MNKETFAKYIGDLSLLDSDTLPEIKAMLDEFPYFQSAWVLYIKNLHAIKDIRYESKLKTACAYISDRKHLHDILKGAYIPAIEPVQTQFIAFPIEENPEEIAIVQPQNLVAHPEEIHEDSSIVQTQFIASQPEMKEIVDTEIQQFSISATPSEEDMTQDITPESETNVAENVQAQFIASQREPEEEISAQEEANVQTQKLASHEENAAVQAQDLVPQEEIIPQPEEFPEDISIVQTQFIASQPEIQKLETPFTSEPDKPESIADRILRQVEEMRRAKAAATENQNSESLVQTQEEANISHQEENPEEIATVQPQNLVAQPDEIAEDASQGESKEEIPDQEESNVKTQDIASQEITLSQIKAILEKRLRDIGINANITFSGNSANIQFENIATDEKPEENKPEQPIAEDESSTEITTAPTIEKQIEKRKNDRNKKANLIDKFIESKARIVPKKDYHSDNKLSTESIIEDEELFTEQLAKIYIKQGHLEKALETYEKLYLKYPEKSIYFATRIEYVKRLMNK